jgi:hypothetical protein
VKKKSADEVKSACLRLCYAPEDGICFFLSATPCHERTQSEQVDARRPMDSVTAHIGVGTFLNPGKRVSDAWQLSFKLVLHMAAVRYTLFPLDRSKAGLPTINGRLRKAVRVFSTKTGNYARSSRAREISRNAASI